MRPVAIPVVSIPIKRHHRHPSAGRTDFAPDFTPLAAAGELRAAPQAPRVDRSALRRLGRAERRVSLETGILERDRAAGRGPTERTRSHLCGASKSVPDSGKKSGPIIRLNRAWHNSAVARDNALS